MSTISSPAADPTKNCVRLYHERQDRLTGPFDARDEEECFTSVGRRIGVWLTTEVASGPSVFAADVDLDVVADYEVTAEDAEHRAFVVPASVVSDLGLLAD